MSASGRASRTGGAAMALMAVLLFLPQQPDHTAELQARFQRESSAVGKGKLMPKLGGAEFQGIQQHMAAGDYAKAAAALGQYRDQVRETMTGLDALGVDAEKHSAGFRQLEISVRESLRRIDDMIVPLTSDEQQPFIEIRKSLDEMDQHLIQELFPHDEHTNPTTKSATGAATQPSAPKQ